MQHLQYLPYGEPYINQRLSGYNERFTFTGKEPRKGSRTPLKKIKDSEHRDEETGYGYFGARYMDHELTTMWLSVDPMSDKYPSISPYAYCAWNPVRLVDPDGEDWYEKVYENGSSSIEYCKDKSSCPEDGRYLGQAYIKFEGSASEHAGKNGSIDADDAESAKVTVYGPNGKDDIKEYNGYTMTSNPEKYGAIAEGEYQGHYSQQGKRGKLPSHYWISNRDATKHAAKNGHPGHPCCFMSGDKVNTNPDAATDWNYGTIYKDGIYIHSTGSNGGLGTRNSTGCLLISDKDWAAFNKQMQGVTNFTVQVTRLYSGNF